MARIAGLSVNWLLSNALVADRVEAAALCEQCLKNAPRKVGGVRVFGFKPVSGCPSVVSRECGGGWDQGGKGESNAAVSGGVAHSG